MCLNLTLWAIYIHDCELLCGCQELNSGPLKGLPELLTSEPLLQLPFLAIYFEEPTLGFV